MRSSVSLASLPTLEEVRAEKARRAAFAAAAQSEQRLELERKQKLDHDAECARCGADAEGIIYWFRNYVWTYDPREKPAYLRFDLWPRQEEFIRWLHARVEAGEEWLTDKSRDVGVTYLCAGYALNRWLFAPGFKTTFGSRKAEYVDKSGQPDSIFEKLRIMGRRLPEWMLPAGFQWANHSLFMRMLNPATGAIISGEGGEDMGRGGRSSLYMVDEAAFVPNAESIEKALSGNTDCVGWVSSVNGMGNLFARKRHSVLKQHQIFRLHWRDDPRKSEEWAAAKKAGFSDPTSWASEYDIDYSASLEGVCIPAKWVDAARRVAKLDPTVIASNLGVSGMDVGGGKAKSVHVTRRGAIVLPPASRGDPDTTETAYWGIELSEAHGASLLNFDSVGIGAGVASTLRKSDPRRKVRAEPINVGDTPTDMRWDDGRTSEEMFGNLKAELWWLARMAFQRTYQHVLFLEGAEGGKQHSPTEVISMPSGDAESDTLCSQLSLVRWFKNEKGKIVIEKKAELARRGIASPDYAEAFMLTLVDRRSRYSLENL
jgi:phage terminase large subunit